MKTVFSSFTVDEKDFGKQIFITQTGLVFVDKEKPLGEKISKSNPKANSFNPGLAQVIGGGNILLGNPVGFLEVMVSGQARQVPFY